MDIDSQSNKISVLMSVYNDENGLVNLLKVY